MSNIQLYQRPTALTEIPKRDSEIALALTSPIFSSLEAKEAYNVMKQCITKAYLLAKYECPIGAELQLITDETMKIFQSRFGSIRQNEIDICFTRGIMGDYGEFKGLALPAFSKFAQAYLKEQSRIKLLTPVETKIEPTKEQKFEIGKNLALATLQKFLEEKPIDIEGATVYRFLRKLGIVVYSEEEQSEFLEVAKEQVIAGRTREKSTSLDKQVRATIEKELNDMSLLETKIIHTAQHNGLVQYFQSLSFEDQPIAYLTNLINEKK